MNSLQYDWSDFAIQEHTLLQKGYGIGMKVCTTQSSNSDIDQLLYEYTTDALNDHNITQLMQLRSNIILHLYSSFLFQCDVTLSSNRYEGPEQTVY